MFRTELNELSLRTYSPNQVIIKAGKNDNERILDLEKNKLLLNNCPQVITDRIAQLLSLGLKVVVNCGDDPDLLNRFQQESGELYNSLLLF